MTPQQLALLREHIDASPDLSSEPRNGDGDFNIAQKLNLPATPQAFTWKKPGQFTLGTLMGSPGYDFTRIDNLTDAKVRIWDEVKQVINLSQFTANLANQKAAIPAVFTTAGDAGMRLSIFTTLQASATRFERIYLAGDGSATNADGAGPLALVVPGPVTPADVQQARALP